MPIKVMPQILAGKVRSLSWCPRVSSVFLRPEGETEVVSTPVLPSWLLCSAKGQQQRKEEKPEENLAGSRNLISWLD